MWEQINWDIEIVDDFRSILAVLAVNVETAAKLWDSILKVITEI